jgi:hypothetical protein
MKTNLTRSLILAAVSLIGGAAGCGLPGRAVRSGSVHGPSGRGVLQFPESPDWCMDIRIALDL